MERDAAIGRAERENYESVKDGLHPRAGLGGGGTRQLKTVAAANRRYFKMQRRMPGMTAVVYQRLGGLMFLSDLDQISLMTWVSLPEMSAKPALAFVKVLHGILPQGRVGQSLCCFRRHFGAEESGCEWQARLAYWQATLFPSFGWRGRTNLAPRFPVMTPF
jgi:hypothetical protein